MFKKAPQVSLVNESEPDEEEVDLQGETDRTVLITEDDEEDHVQVMDPEGGGRFSSGVRRRWDWRFWRRERRYELNHASSDPQTVETHGRKVTLCGRTFHLCKINSWRAIFLVLFVFSVSITLAVIVSKLAAEPPENPSPIPPPQGAVVSDAAICADMGAKILEQEGSAVDAAITTMLCNGVVHAESSGIGGGGFMIIRDKNGSLHAINFRETAPLAATEDMFHSNPSLSKKGGLSVAVPGELKGMEKAHQMFGKLPWKALFDPVVELCRTGYKLTNHTALSLPNKWDQLSPNLRRVYGWDNGTIKKEGDLVQRPLLANTLEAIAANGANAFYKDGPIAQSIVDTVRSSNDGILTLEDLKSYEVKMEEPVKTQFNGHTFYSLPSPGGGPTLLFTLSLMDLYHHDKNSDPKLAYHRLVEAFKFAFASRSGLGDPFCENSECRNVSREITNLQEQMFDPNFVESVWRNISDDHTFNVSYYHAHYSGIEDSGTSHISVLGLGGEAVAVTTTVNSFLGSYLMTDTGVVLNDEMDDFSSPNITNIFGVRPSETNFIRPKKRPLSSTCPTIAVTEDGGVYMVIGASGGTRIPTAVAQAVVRRVSFEEDLSDAVEARRLHHQLVPDYIQYESGFPQVFLDYFEERGHEVMEKSSYAVVQGIVVDEDGHVTAHADSRKLGKSVVLG